MDAEKMRWIVGTLIGVAVLAIVLCETRYELKPNATGGMFRLDHWTGATVICPGEDCH